MNKVTFSVNYNIECMALRIKLMEYKPITKQDIKNAISLSNFQYRYGLLPKN